MAQEAKPGVGAEFGPDKAGKMLFPELKAGKARKAMTEGTGELEHTIAAGNVKDLLMDLLPEEINDKVRADKLEVAVDDNGLRLSGSMGANIAGLGELVVFNGIYTIGLQDAKLVPETSGEPYTIKSRELGRVKRGLADTAIKGVSALLGKQTSLAEIEGLIDQTLRDPHGAVTRHVRELTEVRDAEVRLGVEGVRRQVRIRLFSPRRGHQQRQAAEEAERATRAPESPPPSEPRVPVVPRTPVATRREESSRGETDIVIPEPAVAEGDTKPHPAVKVEEPKKLEEVGGAAGVWRDLTKNGDELDQVEVLFADVEGDELNLETFFKFARWAVDFLDAEGDVNKVIPRLKELDRQYRVTGWMWGCIWNAVDRLEIGRDLSDLEKKDLRLTLGLYRLFPDAFKDEWAIISKVPHADRVRKLFKEVLQ